MGTIRKKIIITPTLEKLKKTLENSEGNSKPILHAFNNYKKFLFLLKKYPSLKAVPTKSIDKIWHYHLELNDLYKKDCMSYFGYFINHKEITSEDFPKQERNFWLTNKLWQKNFGVQLGKVQDIAFCGVDGDDSGSDNDG